MSVPDPSAWRNFPKVRPLVRGPPRNKYQRLFEGYPAELVAQWCEVKVSTAHAYKAGRLKPGASVVKLFKLYAEFKVLTAEWDLWQVRPDAIVDPEGKETNRNLLRNYQLMMSYYHDLARRTGDEREIERYWEFLKAA